MAAQKFWLARWIVPSGLNSITEQLDAWLTGIEAGLAAHRAAHPQALVAPLKHEIERLARQPIAAAELDKIKTQLLTAALNERQTAEGRGMALGWALIHHRDPQALLPGLDDRS